MAPGMLNVEHLAVFLLRVCKISPAMRLGPRKPSSSSNNEECIGPIGKDLTPLQRFGTCDLERDERQDSKVSNVAHVLQGHKERVWSYALSSRLFAGGTDYRRFAALDTILLQVLGFLFRAFTKTPMDDKCGD